MSTRTVCYFGIYDAGYSRTRVLLKGLKGHGINIIECNSRRLGIAKYFDLIKQYRKIKNNYDVLLVAFPGQAVMPLAWLLAKINGKRLIFDSFVSLYNSNVLDRKKHSSVSWPAVKYWMMDYIACKLADTVLLDTEAHIDYFIQTYGIKRSKFLRVLVGTDSSVFFPRESEAHKDFLVHFHGSYIPLQGIEHIVNAAKILENEDIIFSIIGRGQTYPQIKQKADSLGLRNIRFLEKVGYDELPLYMAKADICLGIFGGTIKSGLVIPNKVYEAMAMGKAVITADTPACRGVFLGEDVMLFCKQADPADLAAKIMELKNDPASKIELGEKALGFFKRHLTEDIVTKELAETIKR